jgi:hypothetical protein
VYGGEMMVSPHLLLLVGWSVDVEEFDLQVVRDLTQEAQHQASQRDPDRE